MFAMNDEMVNCDSIKDADGIILSVGYGKSFSNRAGAENGPGEIMNCYYDHLEAFDRFTNNEPYELIKVGQYVLDGVNTLSPIEMVEEVSSFYLNNSKKFILMLGGDHSVSIGAFDGISKIYNPSDVTIVQIDAHPDLRDTPADCRHDNNKISHSCAMRRGVEMGFKTVQVGIRAISIYDHEFIKEKNLKVFEWGRGKVPKIKDIIKSIKTDKVYLTFDIDGLDPAHAPATGTPVPGGLEWWYAVEFIRELVKKKTLVGADIVEVAPFEDDVLTQYSAAHLAYNILSYKLMKDKGILKFYK